MSDFKKCPTCGTTTNTPGYWTHSCILILRGQRDKAWTHQIAAEAETNRMTKMWQEVSDELKAARTSSSYWKDAHLAGNRELAKVKPLFERCAVELNHTKPFLISKFTIASAGYDLFEKLQKDVEVAIQHIETEGNDE